ncbi:hypothetical protein RRG08_004498 [Elysia crispata]|uniref:Uncharacterized protein n=1 Tax=Elysia crispata TaxID=231223 RepID=A0AAE1B9L4_9GAST|nr:hypothetical protein RRG08_004498 [Elysia crispata]
MNALCAKHEKPRFCPSLRVPSPTCSDNETDRFSSCRAACGTGENSAALLARTAGREGNEREGREKKKQTNCLRGRVIDNLPNGGPRVGLISDKRGLNLMLVCRLDVAR